MTKPELMTQTTVTTEGPQDTAAIETMLIEEIRPRLKSGIAVLPMFGADDPEELLQEGLVMALRVLQGAAKAGKRLTPGIVTYYIMRQLRSGRRTHRCRTDPLHPETRALRRSTVYSLDEPVARNGSDDADGDEGATLAEALASPEDDPATQAARRLDWGQLGQRLDATAKEIIGALAKGHAVLRLARPGRSNPVLHRAKQRLAVLIREHLGQDILRQVQELPGWRDNLAVVRQRRVCQWERNCGL